MTNKKNKSRPRSTTASEAVKKVGRPKKSDAQPSVVAEEDPPPAKVFFPSFSDATSFDHFLYLRKNASVE